MDPRWRGRQRDPRWRSRQGEEPPAMDGAARAAMIHGMVGSMGAAMMHGMVGSITTVVVMDPRWRTRNGGQPPAMDGTAGAARAAMMHGMVGSNDELFRQALAVTNYVLPFSTVVEPGVRPGGSRS